MTLISYVFCICRPVYIGKLVVKCANSCTLCYYFQFNDTMDTARVLLNVEPL